MAVLEELSNHKRVFRAKGILHVADGPRRVVFHGVNDRYTLFWDRLWQPEKEHLSQLVFIGRDLEETWFRDRLEQCLASGPPQRS